MLINPKTLYTLAIITSSLIFQPPILGADAADSDAAPAAQSSVLNLLSSKEQLESADAVEIQVLNTGKKYEFTEGSLKIEKVKGEISSTQFYWPDISFPEHATSSVATHFPDSVRKNGEKVLMKVLEGFDGRSPVNKPQDTIHRVQAQLWLKFSDGQYGGSGTLVGPNHIITAGHNVFDPLKKEWVENIAVRLSLHGINIPFNEQKVVKIYTYRGWTKYGNTSYDIALLVLNESIGQRVGWYGMDCLLQPPQDLRITVTGYPMEVSEGKSKFIKKETRFPADRFKTMWTMSSNPEQIGLLIAQLTVIYNLDTSPGQSGSGIWYQTKDGCFVIGVHTYGNQDDNSGTRITQKRLQDICSWISQTYNVQLIHEKVEQPQPKELNTAQPVPVVVASTPKASAVLREPVDNDNDDAHTQSSGSQVQINRAPGNNMAQTMHINQNFSTGK